jgi:hypothetical protein
LITVLYSIVKAGPTQSPSVNPFPPTTDWKVLKQDPGMYDILININSYQAFLKVYGMTITLPRPLPEITFRKITGHQMLSIQGLRKVCLGIKQIECAPCITYV